jgi:hypothetical protein
MAKGDDKRVQQGIDYNTPIQRQNQTAQTQRTNQANDIFYGSPQQQQQTAGPINGTGQMPRTSMGGSAGGDTGPEPSYDSKDPASVDAYIAWMAQQPGVNPSVKNDPGYWRGKMLADTNAGGLGPDASYVKQKMMTPEGAPAGGGNQFGVGGIAGQAIGQQGDIYNRYSQFADTGGFSPQDLQNIRARALSPIKSIYANAQANVNRQKALQGGYSPGFGVMQSRMAREQGQATSDATTGVESNIAQMVQQGRLAGMGGMAGIYGATPGLANMFGNQALAQQQQQLEHERSGREQTQLQLNKANAGRGGAMRTALGIAKIGASVAGAFK